MTDLPTTTTVFKGTWMQRPGTQTTTRIRGTSTVGVRVVHQVWTDGSGESRVTVVRGDGWRPKTDAQIFVEFVRIDNPTDDQVDTLIKRMLDGEFPKS